MTEIREELKTEIRKSYSLIKENKLDEAEKLLHKINEKYPSSPDVWNNLGLVQMRKGNKEEAKYSFDKALSLNRKHKLARKNKQLLYPWYRRSGTISMISGLSVFVVGMIIFIENGGFNGNPRFAKINDPTFGYFTPQSGSSVPDASYFTSLKNSFNNTKEMNQYIQKIGLKGTYKLKNGDPQIQIGNITFNLTPYQVGWGNNQNMGNGTEWSFRINANGANPSSMSRDQIIAIADQFKELLSGFCLPAEQDVLDNVQSLENNGDFSAIGNNIQIDLINQQKQTLSVALGAGTTITPYLNGTLLDQQSWITYLSSGDLTGLSSYYQWMEQTL